MEDGKTLPYSTLHPPSSSAARRSIAMVTLGFASGLPASLIQDVPKAWLTRRGFDVTTVLGLSVLGYPASLKFLWAPLLDRFAPPLLGRRRGWLLVSQAALAVAIAAAGFFGHGPPQAVLAIGMVIAILSASQDIVGDAYRTDVLPDVERGPGTARWVSAYRVALLTAGAGTLAVVDRIGWTAVYAIAAALMATTTIATWFAPEPADDARPPSLGAAVWLPLRDLLGRWNGLLILLFVFLFKLPEVLAGLTQLRFLLDHGYRLPEIAAVKNGLGLAVSIVGTFAGGWITRRTSVRRSLVVIGLAGAVSNFGFYWLARVGPRPGLMPVVVSVEAFCAGMVTAVFVTYLMQLCDRRYSAFQYALLVGLSTLAGPVFGPLSGRFVDLHGWATFYLLSVVSILPAMLLIPVVGRRAFTP